MCDAGCPSGAGPILRHPRLTFLGTRAVGEAQAMAQPRCRFSNTFRKSAPSAAGLQMGGRRVGIGVARCRPYDSLT